MGYVYLTNLNSNAYFDQQGTTISLWNTQSQKQAFMDKLFENASPVEVFSNFPSDSGFRFSIQGNWRNYNYLKFKNGLNPEKYYFIRSVKTFYENNLEKTEITIDYDLINNSNLLLKHLKLNSANNNHLVYRSNLPNMIPTYHNLIRCSNVCGNITSDIKVKLDNIYQLTNHHFDIQRSESDVGNVGALAIYIKFRSQTVPKQGMPAGQYFWEKMLDSIFGAGKWNTNPKIPETTNFDRGTMDQTTSYLNHEKVDFVSYFVKLGVGTTQGQFYLSQKDFEIALQKVPEASDFIESIKFDYIESSILDNEDIFVKYQVTYDKGGGDLRTSDLVWVPRNNLAPFKPSVLDNQSQWIYDIININEWENDLEKSHFVYAHLLPYFFSQKWPKKKFISYFYNRYVISQIIGGDNTFPITWGYTDENVREYFEEEIQSLSSSLTVNSTNNLTDQQRLVNETQSSSLSGIASILGGIVGALLAPETGGASAILGAGIGASISGAGTTYLRGLIGNQIKIREQGILHIGTNEIYKKYNNYKYFTEPVSPPPRYSIDIWQNYFTEQQEQLIKNDREKYGNYLNEYFNTYDYESVIGYHYLESKWISFLVAGIDINTQNLFIRLCNQGVFINFNPEPFASRTVSITSSTNDFIINPANFTITENDLLTLQSTIEDLTFNPDNLIYTEADNIELGSSNNDLSITESE